MNTKKLSIIEENKDFLADEVIEYFKNTHPTYTFDQEFCRRDVHMICDVICGDLRLDDYISSATYGPPDMIENYYNLNRYKGSFLCFRDQNSSTIDVMQYAISKIKLIAKNIAVTPIITTYPQVFDINRELTDDQVSEIDVIGSLIIRNSAAGKRRNQYTDMMEDYFDKGFIHTKIPKNIYPQLWDQVHKTNWVNAAKSTYKKRPDWYQENEKHYMDPMLLDRPTYEKLFAQEIYTNTPPDLIQIADELIKDPMFDYIRLFRPPNPVTRCVHLWNGSENSPHHNDGVDGTDLMIFCYLTDEEGWSEEWGGYINMMKEVGGKFYHTQNILPIDGTMVCVNNSSPIFKHGIRDLKYKEKNRYTFIFHYTWTF